METGNARAIWLDYLRSFVTLLVVAHHAALAYPTFAHFDPTHYIWSTAPVVDEHRWAGMDTLIGFNDLFFMALMFFISGLFVHRGIRRKGAKEYLADRFIRLGVPFLIAEVVLIPLAYLPSFSLATHSTHFITFVKDYILTQQWPVGPPWFIWLLFAFDGVAVVIAKSRPSFFLTFGHWLGKWSDKPVRLGAVIYLLVAICLIPLSLWVGQYTWVGNWGPFDFQLNRVLFYLVFFLIGSGLGAVDWQVYLFKQHKFLGKDWLFWLLLSLVCYVLFVVVSRAGATWVRQGTLTPTEGYFFFDLAFVASCLASMAVCLGYFGQKMRQPNKIWNSLAANAYGMYIVHYGFVTWLQYALLPVDVPAVVKFIIVFVGALSLSWLSSSIARRSQLIARII